MIENCLNLLARQQYVECFEEAITLYNNELSYPSTECIQILNQLLSLNPKYKRLQLAILESGKLLSVPLKFELIDLQIDLNQNEEAIQTVNSIRTPNEAIKLYQQQIREMLKVPQTQMPKQKQIETYKALLQEQEENKYFTYDGFFAYMIPISWLKKWKDFVGIDEEYHPQDQIFSIDCSGLRQILKLNDEIDEEEVTYPGPVDGFKFIDIREDLILDPMPSKRYTSYVLKQNLREGTDFVFVNHRIFEFFKEQYGGFEVKRMIVQHYETSQIYVDLQPRVIQFMIYDQIFKLQAVSGYCKDSLEQIAKRVERALRLQERDEVKWWKFNDYEAQQYWMKNKAKQIKAKPLSTQLTLEEVILADNEYLVLERIQGKQYQLEENVIKKVLDRSVTDLMLQFDVTPPPRFTSDSKRGLTGLQNLGNTCFMNAAMQCLSNTYELTEYMISNNFVNDLNPKNPLGTKGYLAVTYAELMKQMWFGKNSAVSAIDLKRVIGKFAPQFYGYGQQDSHELLSYLLDGLHEDLNRVIEKPVVPEIEITNESDQEASEKFWNNYTKRNKSIIEELMVGQYKSTLVCPKCNRLSKTFDPFMSLSLPIPSYQPIQQQFFLVFADTEIVPMKISLSLSSENLASEIINQIREFCPVDAINMTLIKEHKIKDRVDPRQNVKWVNEHEGLLFLQEVAKSYQDLTSNDAYIAFIYAQKAQKSYESDKNLSYTRELVIPINSTNRQLYGFIYQRFRTHLYFAIKEIEDFVNAQELINSPKPNSLEEYLAEFESFQSLGKQPFTLRIANRDIAYNDNRELAPQQIVMVFLADYLKITQSLKLQRCKEQQLQSQDSKNQTKQIKKGDYHLDDCLRGFIKEEILGKGDEWYCNKCKQHVQATKKMEIYRAPKILIIHLKRFKTNRIHNFGNYYFSGNSQKISTVVHYPLELSLNNFVLSKGYGDSIDYTYDLFGVDNHYGGLGGGHYTAYAFNPIYQKWVDFNDSTARMSSNDVISDAGYVLFYRRRDAPTCKLGK